MKDTIKIITILVVVIFIFSVYPMEAPNLYFIQICMLKQTNSLSQMNNFYTFANKGGCKLTPEDDLIREDEGFALSLTAAKLLIESNEVENKILFQYFR